MRVLMVSHTYLSARYRGKLRWLAGAGGVDLTLLGIPCLKTPTGVDLRFDMAEEPFDVALMQPWLFTNRNPLRVWPIPAVIRLLRAFRPDVVHLEAEPHSLTHLLFARLKPFFGYRLLGFTWENLRQRGRPPLGWFEKANLRCTDGMVAGNQAAVPVLRWRGYQGPVWVVPQVGVDLAHFEPVARTPGPVFHIGYVGRLVEEKGVFDLLEAFIPLAGDCHLTLIGNGPLGPELRARAHAAGIESYVTFAGFVPQERLPEQMGAFDVFVLPSHDSKRWQEQFGHVLVEAMAMGIPVVGTQSGAIPEVIDDAGIVVQPCDPGALRDALVALRDDAAERRRIGAAGRERVLVVYADAALGAQTLEVYRRVVEAP
jgi:glycosyltransferase involved in cell wall biosynthesis